MRNLNIEEIESKIRDYAFDIEHIEKRHLSLKVTTFFSFLDSQPISSRILQRFSEDYSELQEKIHRIQKNQKRDLIEGINTPEFQGALGYFLIRKTIDSNKVYENSFLDLTEEWFDCRGDYIQWKEDFNILIFKPFIEQLIWFISESQSYNSKDYFSKLEISEFNEKLNALEEKITKLGFGQEIIFDEIQELNELLKSLKKKNWTEIFKGKLLDLAIGKAISKDAMEMALKFITGDEIKILNN